MEANSRQKELLKLIDRLKSLGLERRLDIPQLVVCGDQSSGKSSVLECISGIPFPSKDTLCTRFPVEFTMKYSPDGSKTLSATIVPDPKRTAAEQKTLGEYEVRQKDHHQLPEMIADATVALGLDDGKSRFARDVLRVEVHSPDFTNLSLVDLPGIFRWSHGTDNTDCTFVEELVNQYMARPSTIILAIISAKNDYHNQIVMGHAQNWDPQGERTFAIITRPDGVDDSPDLARDFLELAQNKHFSCSGWHVIRARKATERGLNEEDFKIVTEAFYQSGVWKELDDAQKGVFHLRQRLTQRLTNHILESVVPLTSQIRGLVTTHEEQLYELSSQKSVTANRKELRDISTKFTKLVDAAVRGAYTDPFFRKCADLDTLYPSVKLRHAVEHTIKDFGSAIHRDGHKYALDNGYGVIAKPSHPALQSSRDEYVAHVINRLNADSTTKGQFNPELLNELFLEQSEPWQLLTKDLADDIMNDVSRCMSKIFQHVTSSMDWVKLMEEIIAPVLDRESDLLSAVVTSKLPLQKRSNFEQIVIDQIEVARRNYIRSLIETSSAPVHHATPAKHPIKAKRDTSVILTGDVASNYEIDRCNAEEMILCLTTYYDLQLKKLLANLDLSAFDDWILQKLPSIFDHDKVETLPDEVLQSFTTEDPETSAQKEEIKKDLDNLKGVLAEFQKLALDHTQVANYPIRESSAAPSSSKKSRKREASTPLKQRSTKR